VVEAQSMTVADVVAQVCDGRLEDFVREAVALVAREIMESEVAAQVGVCHSSRRPGKQINGHRARPGWDPVTGWAVPTRRCRSVTPDVAGSSPVAPASCCPRRRGRLRRVELAYGSLDRASRRDGASGLRARCVKRYLQPY
jgi:hypothetical protein